MKLKVYGILLLLLVSSVVFCQKKSVWIKVDSNSRADNSPLLILPKMAIQINLSVVEFKYSQGDSLRELFRITDSCKKNSKDSATMVQAVKKSLSKLEKLYGFNSEIVSQMLVRNEKYSDDNITTYKLDKDIKTSFISLADYNKVYKYKPGRKQGFNSLGLNLEYDANGVLVSSKNTIEPKLLPTIISAISGSASLIGAFKSKNAEDENKNTGDEVIGCVTVKKSLLQTLNAKIVDLDDLVLDKLYSLDKAYTKGQEKIQEKIDNEFADLFYSKSIRVIPVQIIFVPGEQQKPSNDAAIDISLFSFNKLNGKININAAYKHSFLCTPSNSIVDSAQLKKSAYNLRIASVPKQFNKDANIFDTAVIAPGQITAVFNIPATEEVVLMKPSAEEVVIDTVVKVPQHGHLGYYSMKLTSLDITYDSNGELKKAGLESKSSLDATITSGSAAIKDFYNAVKKEKEKEKTELEILKDRADKLELLKKISDLEKQVEE